MASLQLLRFCCPVGSPAAELVRHFHPQLWHGLCLGSAGLGLAGLLLQALPGCCRGHGRRAGRGSQSKLCAARGIGAALAASCWLGTAGILGRSVLWLTASPDSVGQAPVNGTAAFAGPLCIVAVMWGQYFYTAHFWALFCYALEAVQLLRRPAGCRPLAPYCLLCWGASSTQCLWGVQQLLSPAHASCDAWHPLAAWHYVAAYVPLVLVLLVNPLLLSRALGAAAALLRRQTGMYTARERLQEWQLRRRFTSITVTFTACWLANVVNDGLLFLVELQPAWHMGTPRLVHVAILTSWIIVAILNPVSGFLLSLAFLGWQSAWQPAGRALCGGRQSSSKDSDERTSPAPVVGLVAPNPHSTLDSRAPLELIYLLAETGALHPPKAELRAPAPREGSPDGGCSIITAGCAPAPLATELLPGTGQAGVTHFPRLAGGTERAVGRSSQARPRSWALLTAGQGAGWSSSLRAGSAACPTGPALAQTGCREGLCQGGNVPASLPSGGPGCYLCPPRQGSSACTRTRTQSQRTCTHSASPTHLQAYSSKRQVQPCGHSHTQAGFWLPSLFSPAPGKEGALGQAYSQCPSPPHPTCPSLPGGEALPQSLLPWAELDALWDGAMTQVQGGV